MRLPVLMYHKVEDIPTTDFLTISPAQLDAQIKYLQANGYTSIGLSELNEHLHTGKLLPKKPILITFDDGYLNNYTNAYPLLVKYNFKAVIFLTTGFIGKTHPDHAYFSVEDIQKMDPNIIEYGLHTVNHESYTDLSVPDIQTDIEKTKRALETFGIPYQSSIAYTFGAFPRKDPIKKNQVFNIMKNAGLQSGFRIGNRINKLPIKNPYLIQRIDVRPTDSLSKFKRMCRFGKKWLLF